MKVKSTWLGDMDVDTASILTFPHGLPAFEDSTQWTLFHEVGEDGKPSAGIIHLLQSLHDPDVTLPVADPAQFGIQYEFELSDGEIAELALADPADLLFFIILYSNTPMPDSQPLSHPLHSGLSANLYAPVLLNSKSRLGIQKILLGSERETALSFQAS